jgi:hypothetical protein
LLAVLTEGRGKREVHHAAEVDRRSAIRRRISIIVDRWWSPLPQERRDWSDVYVDVRPAELPEYKGLSALKLIEKYGRKANMMKWKEQLNGDCPKRDGRTLHERCHLRPKLSRKISA